MGPAVGTADPHPIPSSIERTPARLSLRVILRAVGIYLALWPLTVVLLNVLGMPAVICLTPFAWLLAIPVGRSCRGSGTGRLTSIIAAEAAIAGALLGASQGLVDLAVLYWVSPYGSPYESPIIVAFALLILLVSAAAAAGLAAYSAGVRVRRPGE
jgi:hypothetical protein